MRREIVMPKLGETMEEGIVVAWRVTVGQTIAKGDLILDVETDKAVIEVESLVEGVLQEIVVGEGESVPLGEVLAYVDDPNATSSDQPQTPPPAQPATETPEPAATPAPSKPVGRRRGVPISPRARKLADKLGVDIAKVQGSGPGGRIVEQDIEAAAGQAQPESAASTRLLPHTLLRRRTAEKMIRSWTSIPCYDLIIDVCVDALVELRSRLNASANQKVAVHDLLIRALATALRDFEILTGTWTENGTQLPDQYGIGLAVATPEGLVAPVVRNVDTLNLQQIAAQSADLVAKAQSGQLKPDDLTGACTTISNLGMFGIDHFRPVVIPGQGSILGVGRIRETAVVKDGQLVVARMMALTLAVDHRLADGDYAARFLGAVKDLLETRGQLST